GEGRYGRGGRGTPLARAGVLGGVRGLALGEFRGWEEPEGDYGSGDVVAALVAETGLPCVSGLPIGHGAVNEPIPLGCRARLDGAAGTLATLEPAVSAPAS